MIAALVIIFVLGYLAIVFEHNIGINKAAPALVTGVLCWTIYAFSGTPIDSVEHQLIEKFAEASEILFFLLGAMTIVELIDAHDGFDVLVTRIKTRQKSVLLWLIGLLAFFLSALLDNLTTTIVMISFLRKLIEDKEERWLLAAIVVISANAGGAWSPMGDVTTTMLWIGGQVTTMALVQHVFLPSIACLVVPLLLVSRHIKGRFEMPKVAPTATLYPVSEQHKTLVFILGLVALIFVPIFKTLTHLPPFMGMLLSLGFMWIVTERLHKNKVDEEKHSLSVMRALEKVDTPSIMFFVGILLAVGALESTGLLRGVAQTLSDTIGNNSAIAIVIGILSAIVDNVPLVAAAMGMYPLTDFPADAAFWHLVAYATGTGGSILIIGSAAGVAAMGMEKMSFFWYLKRISLLALAGYLAGCGVFLLLS